MFVFRAKKQHLFLGDRILGQLWQWTKKAVTSCYNPILNASPAILCCPAAFPENEEERLAALEQYGILDTLPEQAFDDLTGLAAYICDTPIALVSLIDANRQWFKSKVGLGDVSETPRESSFCAHAILNPKAVLVIPDATQDERFARNPLVVGPPYIRFYAGAPLVTPSGFPIGTLCAIDTKPRQLSKKQLEALQRLSRQAIAQMELQINLTRLERQVKRNQQVKTKLRASDRQVVDLLENMTDGFFALNRDRCFTYVNPQASRLLQHESEDLLSYKFSYILPELKNSNFEQYINQAQNQQSSITFESRYRDRWLEIRIFPSYEGVSVFFHDITQRKQTDAALKREKQKVESLLLNILPKSIVEKLKINSCLLAENYIAEHYKSATILFADLVNFTQISSQKTPQELVIMLNKIFSAFDRLTLERGLEKIKTIGDAYLVAGGLPERQENSAIAIADLALAMQRTLAELNQILGLEMQLRIGINTGSVVAGVIGTNKFTYDLWGDAVNVASRMESQGQPGKIQISQSTYEALSPYYPCQPRGYIKVKGKGTMKTYWLGDRQ
ncbi:MAG: adenylate/guanylate cyclase domain-containing protein [Spirulinaceae cyanobacterium]